MHCGQLVVYDDKKTMISCIYFTINLKIVGVFIVLTYPPVRSDFDLVLCLCTREHRHPS